MNYKLNNTKHDLCLYRNPSPISPKKKRNPSPKENLKRNPKLLQSKKEFFYWNIQIYSLDLLCSLHLLYTF